uniref:Uncharacterized protein n=1 Tax=Anguilla anguilla TaxID=7936 RepID=A0A0E9XUZ0_ANGAN
MVRTADTNTIIKRCAVNIVSTLYMLTLFAKNTTTKQNTLHIR